MAQMDEIDQQQQKEIEALRRTDIKHDSLINKTYVFFFMTMLAVFVAAFIALPFITAYQKPTIIVNIDGKTIAEFNKEKSE